MQCKEMNGELFDHCGYPPFGEYFRFRDSPFMAVRADYKFSDMTCRFYVFE
jgi:hypothetical protein